MPGDRSAETEKRCPKWFVKFCAGGVSLDNAPPLGRPVEVDSDQMETLIETHQHYTMWVWPTYSKYPNQ